MPTSVAVHVPIALRRRGGRKVIVTPDGATRGGAAVQTGGDPALVGALARAHRWQRLLEGRRNRPLQGVGAIEGWTAGVSAECCG